MESKPEVSPSRFTYMAFLSGSDSLSISVSVLCSHLPRGFVSGEQLMRLHVRQKGEIGENLGSSSLNNTAGDGPATRCCFVSVLVCVLDRACRSLATTSNVWECESECPTPHAPCPIGLHGQVQYLYLRHIPWGLLLHHQAAVEVAKPTRATGLTPL